MLASEWPSTSCSSRAVRSRSSASCRQRLGVLSLLLLRRSFDGIDVATTTRSAGEREGAGERGQPTSQAHRQELPPPTAIAATRIAV